MAKSMRRFFPPEILSISASLVFSLLTLSYSGALKYHTTDPIELIENNCDYEHQREEVMQALSHFRQIKQEELRFVNTAAGLSGIAVIGVFSWPDTATTVWVAKMLWHWSLILSIFALISSAHQRLLRHLPSDKFQEDFDEGKIKLALNLFLSPPVQAKASNRNSPKHSRRRASRRMLWMWQCPTMLMNYSWVLFLVGYGLHVLKPVFNPDRTKTSKQAAIVTASGCLLVVVNFIFCAALCQLRLRTSTKKAAK